MCDSEKAKFIKEQGTSGLLSSLRINTPLKNSSIRSSFVLRVSNERNS